MWLFLRICASIPSNCVPGSDYKNLLYSNGQYSQIERGILKIVQISESVRDIYIRGSFCPPSSGNYAFKYSGSVDNVNEGPWSYYYYINGKYGRESPTFYLNSSSCYKYYISHSTNIGFVTTALYYKSVDNSNDWVLMNSNVSYSCDESFCKDQGVFPNCFESKTIMFQYKSPFVVLLVLFMYLI